MAAASFVKFEDQFLCSICLDVFTDPVSTSCGHNFCKSCISEHWRVNVIYRCPMCKELFLTKPQLKVNTLISVMVAQFGHEVQRHEVDVTLDTDKKLKAEDAERDKKIADLERRVQVLEQHSRINDVIIIGLKIQSRSFAHAVAREDNGGGETSEVEAKSVEQQVVDFLQSKGIRLDLDNIDACYPLPRRSGNDRTAVILKFINRKNKVALLKQGKNLKGTNVYMNDHLTLRNAELAWKARNLKKQKKIQNTWVNNCKIFIKPNASPEDAMVVVIRSVEDLEKYN